jgi:hypothetical protein
MIPHDLETIVRGVRSARKDLREAGAENAASLSPLICEMLETLLQHEADKEAARRRAGDS